MGSFTIFLLISTILACAYALGVSIWIILAVRRRKRGEKDFKYIPLYENNISISKETTITLSTIIPPREETPKIQKRNNDKSEVLILHFPQKEISQTLLPI